MSEPAPYGSHNYAAAFGPPYRPFLVPQWETSVLLRPITGAGREDAAGCYPRTVLGRRAALAEGFRTLRQAGAVSVVLVLDPLTSPPSSVLLAKFDMARPFKRHYIFDRRQSDGIPFSRHHRYEIRRAARGCDVAEVPLAQYLPQWHSLYDALVERHGITGIQRFSEGYFAALSRLSGLVTYAARLDDRIVAMSLWLRHGEHAWSHLAAADAEGYRCGASYLLYATAIEALRDCRWFDLGGSAGTEDDAKGGLARFKRGFANATAEAWLCGKVLDPEAYAQLSNGIQADGFFPAYRRPDPTEVRLIRQDAPAGHIDSPR